MTCQYPLEECTCMKNRHPDHECEDCGVYHMNYLAVKEYMKSQNKKVHEILQNDTLDRACPKCGAKFQNVIEMVQHYELEMIGEARNTKQKEGSN